MPLAQGCPAEPPVLSPEAPPFLLVPLCLGEAAPVTAALDSLYAPCSPGGPPTPCPAPPPPATPPAALPAAGLRGRALLGESWVLWTVPQGFFFSRGRGVGKRRVEGRALARTSQPPRSPLNAHLSFQMSTVFSERLKADAPGPRAPALFSQCPEPRTELNPLEQRWPSQQAVHLDWQSGCCHSHQGEAGGPMFDGQRARTHGK